MKTQKNRSMRSTVVSSILALTLASGLMPAGALAFAAEGVEPDQTQEQAVENEEAEGEAQAAQSEADAAPAITNETVALDASSAASAAEEAVEAEAASDEVAAESAPTQTSPVYTNTTNPNITSAEVPLVGVEETPKAVGSVEFGGIRYTINTDDATTVSATGLATDKPAGEVHIQSQVAISGTLYPVTAIQKIEGGGSVL